MVTMYSTGCPRCLILKKKLEEKGIEFEINDSIEKMLSLGISEVPYLDTGTELLDFRDAVKWVNLQ